LLNPTYMLVTAGVTTEGFAVGGFATFVAKAAESNFVLSSSQAALYVGLTIVPGAAGGIFFGGWFSNKFRLTPKQNALMCAIVAAISLPFIFSFFIGCQQIPLAGSSVRYNPDNDNNNIVFSGQSLDAQCNMGCGCARHPYFPVCANGINYFSPCYAGCTHTLGDNSAGNCSCVSPNPSTLTGVERLGLTVEYGKCDENCEGLLAAYLIMLLFVMFTTFMNNVPATVVSLKCLPEKNRSMGVSTQQIISRVRNNITGSQCDLRRTNSNLTESYIQQNRPVGRSLVR